LIVVVVVVVDTKADPLQQECDGTLLEVVVERPLPAVAGTTNQSDDTIHNDCCNFLFANGDGEY
jgi:hypothetical protein